MTRFLDTLASKLAERWLTLLLLPGALYVAVLLAAVRLGHRDWFRLDLLRHELTRIAAEPIMRSPGTVLLAMGALLAAAALAGLAAQAIGTLAGRLWLARAREPITRWLTGRRVRRWDRAQKRFQDALLAAGRAQVAGGSNAAELVRAAEDRNAERNAIGLIRPTRPFRAGNRIAAVDTRVLDRYQLDLASSWPRLWLVVPDATRAELLAAQGSVVGAQRLAGWGVAYLVVAVVWWPAAVAGVATIVTAWFQAATRTDTVASLVESTVDVHGRALADALGVPCPDTFTQDVGTSITALLRKGS